MGRYVAPDPQDAEQAHDAAHGARHCQADDVAAPDPATGQQSRQPVGQLGDLGEVRDSAPSSTVVTRATSSGCASTVCAHVSSTVR